MRGGSSDTRLLDESTDEQGEVARLREQEGSEREEGSTKPGCCCCCVVEGIVPSSREYVDVEDT